VYGPVRTVVWQGSAGDRRPYAVHRPGTPTPNGLEPLPPEDENRRREKPTTEGAEEEEGAEEADRTE
jgi:hypothetical protein